MAANQQPWQPTRITAFIKALPTGASTVLVETDKGQGYLKALGGRGGPHLLACEWVGTQLAKRLGLPTLDFSLIDVTDLNDIPFAKGGKALPGPAFITRLEKGGAWSGSKQQLQKLVNPEDIGRLVLFDTWTLNCDRFPPDLNDRKPNRDNVFFSKEGTPKGQLLLKAIDHTHCFTCGRDLNRQVAFIDRIQDKRLYGIFPEFWPYLEKDIIRKAISEMNALSKEEMGTIVESIPPEWEVDWPGRQALIEMISKRADFLAKHILEMLWPQLELDFMNSEGGKP